MHSMQQFNSVIKFNFRGVGCSHGCSSWTGKVILFFFSYFSVLYSLQRLSLFVPFPSSDSLFCSFLYIPYFPLHPCLSIALSVSLLLSIFLIAPSSPLCPAHSLFSLLSLYQSTEDGSNGCYCRLLDVSWFVLFCVY